MNDALLPDAPQPVIASARGRMLFDVASIVMIIAIGVILIYRGWGDWADPVYNTGRELYIAQQLAAGKTLYRDIAHLNGPISQHINAMLFRTLGPRASALTIANLILLAGLIAMIWWLWRQIADQLAAAVACIVLLTLFALAPFSRGFNFALPYEHEATHGVIGAFLAICFLAIYLKTQRQRWLIVAGCALGFVSLTKFGIFTSALVPVTVGVIAFLYANRATRRQTIVHLAALLIPIFIIALIAFSFLINDLPARQALASTLGSARWVGNSQLLEMRWYQHWFGFVSVANSLDEILLCAFAYSVLLAPPFAAGVLARGRGEWRTASLIIAPLFVLALMFTLYDAISWQYALRGLTLVIVALAMSFGATMLRRRRRDIDRQLILRLTLVWFSLLLLVGHLGLRAVTDDYGFVFAMPATLVAVAAGVTWVPSIVDRSGGFGWAPRAAMLAALAVLITVYVQRDNHQLARRRITLGEGIDALTVDSRGNAVVGILAELRDRARLGDTLLVAPDGAMLNYLSKLPNPTPYVGLMPPEIAMFGGQARVLESIQRSPPTWFVLTANEAEAFGYKSFTIDYGQEIWRWMEPRYTRVAIAGDKTFSMYLYHHNASGERE